MGRNTSETATIAAMQAAESEDHAAHSAEAALSSETKAKQWADAAAAAAGNVIAGGIITAEVFIYQRSHVNFPPAIPSVSSSYTFGTGDLTGLTNGWTRVFPSSESGDYLFVTYCTISAPNGTIMVDIPSSKWNSPQLMASSGNGDATTAYWMTRTSGVIQKDSDDRYTPEAITFHGLSITGGEPVKDYSGRFKISTTYDGIAYGQVYASASDEAYVSFTIPADIKALKVGMYLAGGLITLLNEELIPVVNDGVSITVKIESTNGDVFKPGQATTTMLIAHVFRNGTEITDQISASNFRWRRVSFSDPPYPNDDATWNSDYLTGYKQVQVTTDGIDSRATFHCDILKD